MRATGVWRQCIGVIRILQELCVDREPRRYSVRLRRGVKLVDALGAKTKKFALYTWLCIGMATPSLVFLFLHEYTFAFVWAPSGVGFLGIIVCIIGAHNLGFGSWRDWRRARVLDEILINRVGRSAGSPERETVFLPLVKVGKWYIVRGKGADKNSILLASFIKGARNRQVIIEIAKKGLAGAYGLGIDGADVYAEGICRDDTGGSRIWALARFRWWGGLYGADEIARRFEVADSLASLDRSHPNVIDLFKVSDIESMSEWEMFTRAMLAIEELDRFGSDGVALGVEFCSKLLVRSIDENQAWRSHNVHRGSLDEVVKMVRVLLGERNRTQGAHL